MLDAKYLRNNLDAVRAMVEARNAKVDVADFEALDTRRRALLTEVEALKAERNAVSSEIGTRKKAKEDASDLIERMGVVAAKVKALDEQVRQVDEALGDWLLSVPNVPHESVPVGKDEADNPVLKTWGDKPVMDFAPKEHWELGTALGGLDFERAAKLTGARFAVLWGWAARLERALAAFMLDLQTGTNGYREVMPPVIVNRESMTGTGQLPKFSEDLFKLENTDYFLIPTAEVPVTNLHRDEIVAEAELPFTYAAFTPCFRSEAGSYGKDTKGLIRQHQFNKVELVRFERPEDSWDALEQLLADAESVLQALGLHYRVVTLCTGDLGFSAAKTYDIEVWLPGQGAYREISSCSNFQDFQARRANLRYRPEGGGKPAFLHTLNGSGLAIGRTLVAVLENFQQADGSIVVPEALRPYMGGMERIGLD